MPNRNISVDDAISYRIPISVTHILVLCNGTSFPVCPRCGITIDREYMNFCDHCGQRLEWKRFSYAKAVYVQR